MTIAREKKEGTDIKRVLFATDFSSASLQALPYAMRIVGRFHSKLYTVVSCLRRVTRQARPRSMRRQRLPAERRAAS